MAWVLSLSCMLIVGVACLENVIILDETPTAHPIVTTVPTVTHVPPTPPPTQSSTVTPIPFAPVAPRVAIFEPGSSEIALREGEAVFLVARAEGGDVQEFIWSVSCLQRDDQACREFLRFTGEPDTVLVTALGPPGEVITVSVVGVGRDGLKSERDTKVIRVFTSQDPLVVVINGGPEEESVLTEGDSMLFTAEVVSGDARDFIWSVSCLRVNNEVCDEVIHGARGTNSIFITAPERPGEQILVSVTAMGSDGTMSVPATKVITVQRKPPLPCSVTVTRPGDDSEVGIEIIVSGTTTMGCEDIGPLWVVVEFGGVGGT